jgi:hypothetical protein
MNVGYLKVERRVGSRRTSVLRKLGISNLVSTAMFDIASAHEALVRRQAVPERIFADGLVVDVPAGVYHPLPDSSSEFFIRNIKAMNPNLIAKSLEIGRELDLENGCDGYFADRCRGHDRQRQA